MTPWLTDNLEDPFLGKDMTVGMPGSGRKPTPYHPHCWVNLGFECHGLIVSRPDGTSGVIYSALCFFLACVWGGGRAS